MITGLWYALMERSYMSGDRFTYKEMQELLDSVSDIEIGQTKNTHHCKEGRNNDRCYITRNTDVTLFYCHHCGKRGAIMEKFGRVKQAKEGDASGRVHGGVRGCSLPTDISYSIGEWPARGKLWLAKGGINDQECSDRGIGYSPMLQRVVLPVTYEGEFQGYVARAVMEGQEPKYLTKYKEKDKFIYHIDRGTDDVVIVEDILSCIRISRFKSCIAMLGTNVSDSLLALLVRRYSNYIVWNDYDNPEVKIKAHKLKQHLELFGDTKLLVTDLDPKELTDEEIEKWLS